MVRAILHGCKGRMGRFITEMAAADDGIEIVAGVDMGEDPGLGYPFYNSVADVAEEADVVSVFPPAAAVDGLLDSCAEKGLGVIVCTTGLSDAQLEHLAATTVRIPVLRSANMSLGVNLLMQILGPMAKTLAAAGFDIEIVEKHHNQKLDAPSGTAIALADSINEAMDGVYDYTFDRSQRRQKRDPKEIGFSAVRGGSIVGEHDVIFAGKDEVVTVSHTAFSRAIFANGAIQAAKFMAGKPAGFYTMADVLKAD
ncbi:MAG: 4-hydroxy-tetrahydrodipicolinate reductase [Lachnospiraceae bacterium]|nr:4-hydroxy-tetrahydrodipicolinate reductase [Lachnospiraceae bacterium]